MQCSKGWGRPTRNARGNRQRWKEKDKGALLEAEEANVQERAGPKRSLMGQE